MKPLVMTLHFNPHDDPVTDAVFQSETARTLYLLWRRSHIVGDTFAKQVLGVASKWDAAKPTSIREASLVFPRTMEFSESDVVRFLEEHWEYFTGQRQVEYLIKTEADD